MRSSSSGCITSPPMRSRTRCCSARCPRSTRVWRPGVRRICPSFPIQYRDFAAWQLERLQGPVLAELVAYWTNELRGAPQLLPLPTDRPRLPVQRHEGGRHEVALPGELADSVRSLARAEGCTVFMVLLGAFSTLLYRLTGRTTSSSAARSRTARPPSSRRWSGSSATRWRCAPGSGEPVVP